MKASFHPGFLYITFAWCASKLLQWCSQSQQTIWETSWNWFLDVVGDDEFFILTFVTGSVSLVLLIIFSALFLFMDITLKPDGLRKYKVQLHENEPPDFRKVKKVLLLILFNQVFVSIPFAYVFFYLCSLRGIPNMRQLEDFSTTMANIFLCLISYEVCFYATHRTLHSKLLYKRVHKIHHEWTASIAIVAAYAHPLEHLTVNLLSVLSGIFVTGCHIATGWLWIAFLLILTLIDHSGYHLPFLQSPEYHDYHHLKFNVNYGSIGLMDYLFGTDKSFRNTVNEKRHRVLLSLKSARERFPDPQTPRKDD